MKKALFFIAAITCLASCSISESGKRKVPEINPLNEHNKPEAQSEPETSDKSEDNKTDQFVFVEFWEDFQEAVKENNTEAILRMTTFPFETRGEMDSDPIVKYNETQMRKVLPLLLKQEVIELEDSGELVAYTEGQMVLQTKEVNQEEIETGNVRVSSLVFERGGNGWKFTFAYLNAPTRKAIGK